MKGPFTATLDVGAPFRVESESYAIAAAPATAAPGIVATESTGRQNIWPMVILLSVIAAGTIVFGLRKRPAP